MIDARTIPPCIVCRRLTCADYRTCQGELAALCERVANRAHVERPERHRDRSAA